MPDTDSQRPDTARDPAQPGAGPRPTGAKDDPHRAPESGDKPDAATPDDNDLSERAAPT
jgi:hypothetical protein